MEVYVDEFGNEVTVQSLQEMFGEQWETEAANLGYSKKAEGVVAEDATVTPITPVASENTVSDLENSSLELDDEWQVIVPCLLYTSPSPRDVEESRMPSSA